MVGSTELPTTDETSPGHAPRKISKPGIGRPRLEDSQSKTDRRRKQIREAQRNYRLRKEASVRDLQQRIVTLESTLTFLRSSYVGLYQSLCKIASTTGSQELSTLLEREKANVLAQSDDASFPVHIQPSASSSLSPPPPPPPPLSLSGDPSASTSSALLSHHQNRRRKSSGSTNLGLSPPSAVHPEIANFPHFDNYATTTDLARPNTTNLPKEQRSSTTPSSSSTSSSAGFRKSQSYHDERPSSSFHPLGLPLPPPPPQPTSSRMRRSSYNNNSGDNNKEMQQPSSVGEDSYLFKVSPEYRGPPGGGIMARESSTGLTTSTTTTSVGTPAASGNSGRESLAEKLVIQFLQTTLRALEENSLSILGRMFPQGYCRKLLLPQIRHLLTIPPRQVIRMWEEMDRGHTNSKLNGMRRNSAGEKDIIKREEPRLSFSSTSSTGTTLSSGMIDRRLDQSPDLFRTESNVSDDSKPNTEHVENRAAGDSTNDGQLMNAQAIEEYIEMHGWHINPEIFLQSLLEKDVVVRGTPVYKKSLVDYAIFLAAQL